MASEAALEYETFSVELAEGTLTYPLSTVDLTISAVYVFIGILGVLGGLLVIRSLISYPHIRIAIFIMFGGLAAADIMCLLFGVPYQVLNIMYKAPSDFTCKATLFIASAAFYISAFHVVVLAVLRGILLTNRDHTEPSGRLAVICSLILWVIGCLACIPILYSIQLFTSNDNERSMCDHNDPLQFWQLTAAFQYGLPLGLVIFVYVVTHYVCRRFFSDSYSLAEWRMSRLITTVMVLFATLNLPFHALNLYLLRKSANPDGIYPDEGLFILRDYLKILLYVDKFVRPIVLIGLSLDFEKSYLEIVNCTVCKKAKDDEYHTPPHSPLEDSDFVDDAWMLVDCK